MRNDERNYKKKNSHLVSYRNCSMENKNADKCKNKKMLNVISKEMRERRLYRCLLSQKAVQIEYLIL